MCNTEIIIMFSVDLNFSLYIYKNGSDKSTYKLGEWL